MRLRSRRAHLRSGGTVMGASYPATGRPRARAGCRGERTYPASSACRAASRVRESAACTPLQGNLHPRCRVTCTPHRHCKSLLASRIRYLAPLNASKLFYIGHIREVSEEGKVCIRENNWLFTLQWGATLPHRPRMAAGPSSRSGRTRSGIACDQTMTQTTPIQTGMVMILPVRYGFSDRRARSP
jgi:hypothetical protein